MRGPPACKPPGLAVVPVVGEPEFRPHLWRLQAHRYGEYLWKLWAHRYGEYLWKLQAHRYGESLWKLWAHRYGESLMESQSFGRTSTTLRFRQKTLRHQRDGQP